MDEWELALCEKIFSVIKEKGVLPDVILKHEALPREDWNDPKRIKSFNRLVEILDHHRIIDKRPGVRNGSYSIHVGSNTLIFDSFQEYLSNYQKKKELAEELEAIDIKKRKLEIRYLEVQIWANEKWYLIAGVSALIGVVATKLIETILNK